MRPLAFLRTLGVGLADIVAPPRCVGCLQEGIWLCAVCLRQLGTYPLSCIVCEKPHPRGFTCPACQSRTPLSGVVSVDSYRSPALQRGIGWLKFKGVRPLASVLAQLLMPRLLAIAPWEQLQTHACLVPIPLHQQRMRERGFNQSFEIARHLSYLTGIVLHQPLVRQQATWTQSHLPKELRASNVAAAFALRETQPLDCKIFILVDDVTTSGSTLGAAATALRLQPDAAIWGTTIARG